MRAASIIWSLTRRRAWAANACKVRSRSWVTNSACWAKKSMFRWYWPDEVKRRLYDNEYLDEQELDRIEAGVGRDRVTVHVYAYTP